MANYEELLECIINEIKHNKSNKIVPVGISNRHIHLSQQAVIKLFGEGYELTQLKPLSQKGQFACKECVTLCGPKGVIEKVSSELFSKTISKLGLFTLIVWLSLETSSDSGNCSTITIDDDSTCDSDNVSPVNSAV